MVLPLVPCPPDRGDRLRAWDMLTALREIAELHLALVVREEADAEARASLARVARTVHWLPLGTREAWAGRIRGAVAGMPPGIAAYWSPRVRREIATHLSGPWDLAVAFQLRAAPYVHGLTARAKVLELTDSLAYYRRQLPWRGRALVQKLAFAGVERLERRMPRAFDVTVVSAAADADIVEALSGRRPVVVPNGTPPIRAVPPYRSDGPLLFVGDMRYPPNEDGIVWFARRIWPGVRATVPGLTLRIVGRTTARVLRLAGLPGVQVAGYVPDLADEFAGALAVINPMRFGSGTNRKVLDAWAAGRPVVSTPAGGRGLGCRDGQHLLLAQEPGQWVQAVQALRRDGTFGVRLGQAGREMLQAGAQWDAWREAFSHALEGGVG